MGIHGVKSRLQCYVHKLKLPVLVEKAMKDGYKITHTGYLVWVPIPANTAAFLGV